MEIKVKAKDIKISPRKVRLVASLVRKMTAVQAIDQLNFTNKKATDPVGKLLQSGIASAEHNYELDKNNLFIKEIRVDEGKTLKRWMPKAHGRATTIRKRTSHIHITLAEIKDSGKKEAVKQKLEAPIKLGEATKAKTEKADDKKATEPIENKTGGKQKVHGSESDAKKGFVKKIFQRKAG